MCQAEGLGSSPPPAPAISSSAEPAEGSSPAVPKLVSSVPPLPSMLPPAASLPVSTANNNAERTSERIGIGPYAAAGTAGGDSMYASVAALKGRDASSGAEVEVLSASIQLGAQNEGQLTFVRVAGGSGALRGSTEAFTARANIGIHNDDGSTGLNVGAGAAAVGFEATIGRESSLTTGLAASIGYGASVGVRDVDGDGKTELCARVSGGPITIGLCVESPR